VRKFKLISIFLVLVSVLGLAVDWFLQPAEPAYEGHTVTFWLHQAGRNGTQRSEAKKAFETMGTRAVPFIIRQLEENDSIWPNKYGQVFPNLPAFLRKFLPQPRISIADDEGFNALLTVGPPVKPALLKGLKNRSVTVRRASAAVLGFLKYYDGTDINDAIPALTETLGDSDRDVLFFAANSISLVGHDAESSVPALVPLLSHSEFDPKIGSSVNVHSAAARALGKIGSKAQSAVPGLRKLLQDTDPYTACMAAVALWRIDGDATNTLPVLIHGLSRIQPNSQWEVIEGLQEMGPRAKGAIPALKDQLSIASGPRAPSSMTREKITNAWAQIDPESAAQSGAKSK
jgi:hypothetical protein